ncbi:hypothetical protein [Mangrovibacter plantisponsor]|uniref:Uncharacterized protein n=1 Tax=Mangrovibacter plantisponsor TaxID=451513 RepID=A0A317Q7R9_9ENTR|nr:hypothetical protein [Mangrovibacter plantisponsor]PWW11401.1 hypothetical protein DES37_1023 [Mangrovibacter plantisponsor]
MKKNKTSILLQSVFATFIMLSGIHVALANTTMTNEEGSVISQVKHTVETEKLITNPECTEYLFTANAEPGVDLVDVMEKHGGKCGLDPQVQHRLFSVYVDQKTHQMATDDGDPEGNLKLLPPAE